MKCQDVIRRLRRRAGGAHDGAVVLPQHLEPRADIVGMAHGRGDAERGAQVGRRNFRNQLFERIFLRSERAGQVTVEACRMAAGVADLMERRPMPVDRFEISLWRRDLREIMPWVVEGSLATDAEIQAGCADQCLGLGQDQIRAPAAAPSPSSPPAGHRIAPC